MDTAGVDHCLPLRLCGASGVYLSLALVNVHRVDLRNRGTAVDRMACTNVSTVELTLSAVTSGAWVIRTISFSLLIQSSLVMLARKFSFSRSSHNSLSVFSEGTLAAIPGDTLSWNNNGLWSENVFWGRTLKSSNMANILEEQRNKVYCARSVICNTCTSTYIGVLTNAIIYYSHIAHLTQFY